ncbi:MAG: TRAP transporter small permease [Actinomycetales bacterium]|nr:TRAP transporter small permease [Actinomycetales bacterium]
MARASRIWGAAMAGLGSLSGLLYAALIVTLCVDLLSRVVTGRSVPGLLEASEVVMVVAVGLALGPAESDGSHVRTGLVLDRLPSERIAVWTRRVGAILPLAVAAILVYALFDQALQSTLAAEVKPGIVPIPVYPAKIALCFGAAIFFIEYARSSLLRPERREAVLV